MPTDPMPEAMRAAKMIYEVYIQFPPSDASVEKLASIIDRSLDLKTLLAKVARVDEAEADAQRNLEATIPTGGDYVCSECCLQHHDACLDRSECDCVTCLKTRAEQAEAERDRYKAALERIRDSEPRPGRDRRFDPEVIDSFQRISRAALRPAQEEKQCG